MPSRLRSPRTLVGTVALLGFAAVGILAASAANSSFVAVVNPLKQLPAGGYIAATWCASASDCVAVGGDGGRQPLSLVGNPATWSAEQAREVTLGHKFGWPATETDPTGAGGNLSAISCRSSSHCVAVGTDGNYEPLVLAGNPSTWSAAQAREITVAKPFRPGTAGGAGFSSVTCTSASWCVAAGSGESENGVSFLVFLTGNPATWGSAQAREFSFGGGPQNAGAVLTSLACTSPTACVAVGVTGWSDLFVLTGDPTTWTDAQAQQIDLGDALGHYGALESIVCTSSTSCTAVGEDGNNQPLVFAGNPSTWTAGQAQEITLGPGYQGGDFTSIACASSTSCMVVGHDRSYEPIALAGDPATWGAGQVSELTSFPGNPASIVCLSATSCVVVGGDGQPLTLVGDPATWNAGQAHETTLNGHKWGAGEYAYMPDAGLTCPSARSCFKLGYSVPSGPHVPFILRGDPAHWDHVEPKVMSGLTAPNVLDENLAGATCASRQDCVAVGWRYDNAFHGNQPLVLTGNPSTWASKPPREVPVVTASYADDELASVSCVSSTYCVAVGTDKYGNWTPLVLAGNPATWSIAQAKVIEAPGGVGSLVSVTCPSHRYCVAVGQDDKGTPLVLAGNPATWGEKQLRRVDLGGAFGHIGNLAAVACTSIAYCMAVGESGGNQYYGDPQPFVLRGDPARWGAKHALNPEIAASTRKTVGGYFSERGSGYLVSISCRGATFCVAVGGDKHGAPLYITGDPRTWTSKSLLARPRRTGPFATAKFTSTYCTPTVCFASGFSNGGDFVIRIK